MLQDFKWQNKLTLTINISQPPKEVMREIDGVTRIVYESTGQWEGMNVIFLKFYNQKSYWRIKTLKTKDIITVTGEFKNFFNSKQRKTFASIIVKKYQKVAKK